VAHSGREAAAAKEEVMVDDRGQGPSYDRWARLRFAVVGPLLADPPARGELRAALVALAQRDWQHPVLDDERVRFALSTIERWYYLARKERDDPLGVLRRKVRRDLGQQRVFSDRLKLVLRAQYDEHKGWSAKLHRDNLAVLVAADPTLGTMPSYASVRRFLRQNGLVRRRRLGPRGSPGAARAEARFEQREVRSYEAAYVNGLWHWDYHVCSRELLLPSGDRVAPVILGILDDRSRLCCHAQWYLQDECAETLAHGVAQAIQKRDLPRAALMDNGAAMIAAETREGLLRLGITQDMTLPYSPYQNAKQEVFWAQLEGRLMAMLEGVPEADLTLALLNEATQSWVELEYHRTVHSEIHDTPLARFLAGPSVGRPSPSAAALRAAFRREVTRTQRRSDGTFSLAGTRFEVPDRYRHFERLAVRYASWDLGRIDLVDPRTGAVLGPVYPLDRTRNADGERRQREPLGAAAPPPASGMAPLLKKLMADYAATGLPPAYVPFPTEETSR
jgi:transposase InsO family protein